MASRVAVRSAGRGERAGTVRLPSPEPPLGDGGTREAHPSERRRTGEPSPARLGFPRPGHGTTEFREGHEVGARAPSMRTATSMASIMLSGLAMPFHARSKAVPWSTETRRNGSPIVTFTPESPVHVPFASS
jgi:hypothetical protein